VRLPKRLITTLDRWVEYDVGVMKNTLDADLSALRAPNAVRQPAMPPTPAPQTVTVTPVAKGIWFLTGGAIPNLVVEFADHVAIVEAGSEARFRAVLAKAGELVPNKPVTQLVLSHHHFDHTGGLRAAVAEGLTVFAHRVNEAWFRDAARRRHSIEPDALSRSKRDLRLERVEDSRTLRDDTMEMTLYHLVGSTHGDGILAVYFPRERLYAEADVWNPGAQIQPHVRSLMDDIRRRGLQIERIVPLHGQQVRAFAELQKDAQFWSGRRFTTTTAPATR
jgi:glyoxylase-like metal-dependent hydrolase (beta-lactamase superfamily II)